VVDTAGNPVSGAAVVLDNNWRDTSGANGGFNTTLSSYNPATGATAVLKATKAGYLDAFKMIEVSSDSLVNGAQEVSIVIQPLPTSQDEATQARIVRSDGSTENVAPVQTTEGGATFYKTTVTLSGTERAGAFDTAAPVGSSMPEASFQIGSPDGTGTNAAGVLGTTGRITGSVAYGDPTDAADLETFPGDFTTRIDTGGGEREQALITAGFVRINLTDGSGAPITSFAPGQTAKITMTIPPSTVNPETGMLISPGDTIPLFVFNESTGRWVVERTNGGAIRRATVRAANDGTLYAEFETSHLSDFNLDWPSDRCSYEQVNSDTPIITIVDSRGSAINGATLKFNSASGWSHYSITSPDNKVTLWLAPKNISWQVWAEKDGLSSNVATVTSCKETISGQSEFTLVIGDREPACSSDAACNDSNPLTVDRCRNAGTPTAYCSNVGCRSTCSNDAACDDGNALTTDSCVAPNTCSSYCSHTACSPGCSSDAQCEDNNPNTLNTCMFAGTCNATCQYPAVYCDLSLDKVNYIPGETMLITLNARNEGSVTAKCGVGAALKNNMDSPVWNSFDDQLFITILPGQTLTRTISKIVPGTWPGTDTNAGADYAMYSIHDDGSRWDRGDNFNIKISRQCVPACTRNSDCENNMYCLNPGSCGAYCSSTCTPACSNDTQCADADALTVDACINPGTCDSSCTHTACTPACTSDAQCNDGNALTVDSCLSPNTCAAACAHAACTPVCTSDAQCNDDNALTIDACVSPNTCAASCSNTAFTPDCSADSDCNDGNAQTTDVCVNPGTITANCVNAGVTASIVPTIIYLSGGQAQETLTCATVGNVTSLEGRCSESDTWRTIASGNTMTCTYTSKSSFTASCRANGVVTASDATPVVVGNQNPDVSISATPTLSVTTPVDVTFTSTCTDPDGNCVSYLWDFGDGSPTSSLANPTHTYSTAGYYTARLTVTDDNGATAYTNIRITVNRPSLEWTQIDGGNGFTCALTSIGGVKCWGANIYGQLGDGTSLNVRSTPVDVTGLTTGVSAISTGGSHACALTSSGGVKCWGLNGYGQLGDGTTISRLTPVDVSGLTSGVTDITTGLNYSCALTTSGGVKCWGSNNQGQLGNTTTIDALSPIYVSGLSSGVSSIAAGGSHACAVTTGGGVKCWGYDWGFLGDGTSNQQSLVPIDVSGLSSGVASVAASDVHTCALTTTGGVKCWGANNQGECGDGEYTTPRLTPVDVIGLTSGVTSISASYYHTCALTVGGGVKCWGVGGGLGNGSSSDSSSPVDVSGLSSGLSVITAGYNSSCAISTTGVASCWGNNTFGQLGNGSTATSYIPVTVPQPE